MQMWVSLVSAAGRPHSAAAYVTLSTTDGRLQSVYEDTLKAPWHSLANHCCSHTHTWMTTHTPAAQKDLEGISRETSGERDDSYKCSILKTHLQGFPSVSRGVMLIWVEVDVTWRESSCRPITVTCRKLQDWWLMELLWGKLVSRCMNHPQGSSRILSQWNCTTARLQLPSESQTYLMKVLQDAAQSHLNDIHSIIDSLGHLKMSLINCDSLPTTTFPMSPSQSQSLMGIPIDI